MQQAVSNLVDNAIKYTPDSGSVHVALRHREGMARFEVTDSGYGIPETEQSNLFQPFKRVKTEETKTIEGTGLGLYSVKRIIERNRGEIIFTSQYGKGSTFGFTLPLVPE
ncbi:MAG: ATP-binding protein [Anaerolineae bacterium]